MSVENTRRKFRNTRDETRRCVLIDVDTILLSNFILFYCCHIIVIWCRWMPTREQWKEKVLVNCCGPFCYVKLLFSLLTTVFASVLSVSFSSLYVWPNYCTARIHSMQTTSHRSAGWLVAMMQNVLECHFFTSQIISL